MKAFNSVIVLALLKFLLLFFPFCNLLVMLQYLHYFNMISKIKFIKYLGQNLKNAPLVFIYLLIHGPLQPVRVSGFEFNKWNCWKKVTLLCGATFH